LVRSPTSALPPQEIIDDPTLSYTFKAFRALIPTNSNLDWESLGAHKRFESLDIYKPFLEKLGLLLASAPVIFHIALPSSTPSSTVLSAPVTEFISLFFQKSFDHAIFDANFAKFRSIGLETVKEAQGVVGAWSLEEVKHDGIWKEENGEEGLMFLAFAGWPSVQVHMEFRETEAFKQMMPLLREGPLGMEVFHVELKKVE
jgi:hypothetical protein